MCRKVDERRLSNRLLPDTCCRLCGSDSNGRVLCRDCAGDLPPLGPVCRLCACSLTIAGTCPHCQRRPPPFARCLAAYKYDFPLSGLIHEMKYGGQPGLCQALGDLMLPVVRSRNQSLPDGLVPMPLHRRRMLTRGYNQALELARPLAAALGRPLLTGLCQRVRATRPQTLLAGRSRRDNVHNAFAVQAPPPAHVAIIDDVMTSGHTAAALGRCLHDAGATQVEIWVLARAGVSD